MGTKTPLRAWISWSMEISGCRDATGVVTQPARRADRPRITPVRSAFATQPVGSAAGTHGDQEESHHRGALAALAAQSGALTTHHAESSAPTSSGPPDGTGPTSRCFGAVEHFGFEASAWQRPGGPEWGPGPRRRAVPARPPRATAGLDRGWVGRRPPDGAATSCTGRRPRRPTPPDHDGFAGDGGAGRAHPAGTILQRCGRTGVATSASSTTGSSSSPWRGNASTCPASSEISAVCGAAIIAVEDYLAGLTALVAQSRPGAWGASRSSTASDNHRGSAGLRIARLRSSGVEVWVSPHSALPSRNGSIPLRRPALRATAPLHLPH